MWAKDNLLFEQLADKCGNRYLAVMYVARASRALFRSLSEKFSVDLIESHVITWALTGQVPDIEKLPLRPSDCSEISSILDFLSYVEDEEVKEKVIEQYKKSVKEKHLVYITDRSMSIYRKDRINILLRMIWYDFS